MIALATAQAKRRIDYQEQRIMKRFVVDDDEVKCLCVPTVDAEGLVFIRDEDEVYVEVGMLKEVVNLLKEGDSEKCAGSEYKCPDLFHEVTVEVHRDAKIRKYLGFDRREKNTQLDVVAEDLWANDGLRVLAAEIELWHFLSQTEASDLMMLKLEEIRELVLVSIRGPTRAKRLAGYCAYWFATVCRRFLMRKFFETAFYAPTQGLCRLKVGGCTRGLGHLAWRPLWCHRL